MDLDISISDTLTNLARPKTSATLTLRIIKSFEYRTEKSLILHDVNLITTTVGELKDMARKGLLVPELFSLFLQVCNDVQLSKRNLPGNHIVPQS